MYIGRLLVLVLISTASTSSSREAEMRARKSFG